VACLCFRPGGRALVTGSWDGAVRVWDLTASPPRAVKLNVPPADFTRLAVTPDDKLLLAGDVDGTVTIWDLAADKKAHAFTQHEPHAVTGLAVLGRPGGARVVSADADGVVRLWDAATGRPEAAGWVGGDGINDLAVSPDGKRLACGCQDSATRVWDIADLEHGRHVFAR
jgi:WD40 repeat protein